ncbi:MAG: glycosyltransferase [Spirochaetales bacterium]|nr:glycosyltransferase [Spirochaetales bacterium]
MNILLVSPYLPEAESMGGMRRFVRFMHYLESRHNVYTVCLDNRTQTFSTPERMDPERVFVVKRDKEGIIKKIVTHLFRLKPSYVVKNYTKTMAKEIKRIVSEYDIDLVHIEFIYMGDYACAVSDERCVKVLVDQELNFRRIERELKYTASLPKRLQLLLYHFKFKRYEVNICRYFDSIYTTTRHEKELLEMHAGVKSRGSFEVYANVIDSAYFRPDISIKEEPTGLIFTGNYRHNPNAMAVDWFYRHVFPIIEAAINGVIWYIVGPDPGNGIKSFASDPRIIVTGAVDDIRPYLARAAIFINPVVSGGGMRGKVLEAMAMHKPVVSTTIGMEGIEVRPDHDAFVRDTPEAFAEGVVTLMKSASLRKEIGANGRRLVEEKYDDRTVFAFMERRYKALVDVKRRKSQFE